MIPTSVQNAMNAQIKNELASAYLYLSMAAHFEASSLPGFATWMKSQANEEAAHAMKFFTFINERGGRVILDAIEKPPADFKSPLEVMQQVYQHEQKVSSMINDIYALVLKENDYPSQVMLQWFINEQVEEEKSALEIVDKLKMIGNAPAGLLMLDQQLGQRPQAE